jgi:hypothetical protein
MKNNLTVLPGILDLIVAATVFTILNIFPHLLIWGIGFGIAVTVASALATGKGWWRVILLVPLVTVFLMAGGQSLPPWWS